MKISLDNAPEIIKSPENMVKSGNVYRNQKGLLYVICNVRERPDHYDGDRATAFVVDRDGEITNVVHYSTYYFSRFKMGEKHEWEI